MAHCPLEVLQAFRIALAPRRLRRGIAALAPGGVAWLLGPGLELLRVVESPHHPIQRDRVQLQLGGQRHVTPDVTACGFGQRAPRESPARARSARG